MAIVFVNVEFQTSGHWKCVQIHPKLIPSKSHSHQDCDDKRSFSESMLEAAM